jgi:hypothetical protein
MIAPRRIRPIPRALALSMEIDYKSTEASHIALRAKQVSGVLTNFKVVLPDATSITANKVDRVAQLFQFIH